MPLFKKYLGISLAELKEKSKLREENRVKVEIKRKPVDKIARVKEAILEARRRPYFNHDELSERIDSIYNSKEEGEEIENIKMDFGVGAGVAFFSDKSVIKTNVFAGCFSSTKEMTKAEAVLLAEGILSMCEQME